VPAFSRARYSPCVGRTCRRNRDVDCVPIRRNGRAYGATAALAHVLSSVVCPAAKVLLRHWTVRRPDHGGSPPLPWPWRWGRRPSRGGGEEGGVVTPAAIHRAPGRTTPPPADCRRLNANGPAVPIAPHTGRHPPNPPHRPVSRVLRAGQTTLTAMRSAPVRIAAPLTSALGRRSTSSVSADKSGNAAWRISSSRKSAHCGARRARGLRCRVKRHQARAPVSVTG